MATSTAVNTEISSESRKTAGSSYMSARHKGKGVSAPSAYRLSRVEAEGWNAAHRISSAALEQFDASKIDSLNPHASDPERARWTAGFTSAFKS